jgi:DNA-binding GntR family transcriptional regulator
MPVREALRRLLAEGAFGSLPNHSARIPFPTREDVAQINQLRLIMESNSVRQAVEHLSFPADVIEYARLNEAFQFGIYGGPTFRLSYG